MGRGKKNRKSQQNGQNPADWQNVAWFPVEETRSQNSFKTSTQNTSCEDSGTELNVPRQQDHSSSQNMKAVAFGHQSDRYDDKAQSESGSHDVFDQKPTDSYHNTRMAVNIEYHDISRDVSQSHRTKPRNYHERNCRDKNHLQHSHSWKDCHERERCRGGQYHKQNSYHYDNPSQEPKPLGKISIRTMSCDVCTFEYNANDRKPRNLKCGHSFCSVCVEKLIQNFSIMCPNCRQKTNQVHSTEKLAINYSLLQLLQELSKKSAPPKQEKSPHSSKCFEVDAPIESHCATCKQWVCIDCGRIDHNSDTCNLLPCKEKLSQIVQAKKSMAENAHHSLKESVSEAKKYSDILTNCLDIMETTLDCIKKEHKRFGKIAEDSKQVEADLQLSIADVSKAKDLKENLSLLKKVEESVIYTEEWASSVTSSHRRNNVKKLSKELLCTTVGIHSASTGNGSSSGILAMHTVNNTEMFSKLMCEGGHIHMFSLAQTVPPSGSHALPLESIKSCMDSASALTFLDLSWGGSHGRVYIRLTGDSLRGRQFLILCTGEEGPSLRNTPFHRVWWKGLPGEHVWGGDYNQSDGSGGTQVKSIDENEMPHEAGRKLPITAGLVAGRYEKTNISSLFRIFTKDAKDVEEEAAFGQVEYGLEFVDDAINHNNIQDVIISDCGIVIEL